MLVRKTFVKPHWLLPLLLFTVLFGNELWGGSREAMADAMAKMMEAMGLFESGPSTGNPFGGPGWAPGFAMPGGMPWGSPFQDPSSAFGMGEMMRQFSQGARSLEGIWEGRDGELLIVQGNRFRIYSPGLQRVDGYIQVKGNRLALFNPADENARAFEYAESQGRLIMRGTEGEVYLYRRLRLDPIEPTASAPSRGER